MQHNQHQGHSNNQIDHSGHEQMFRDRFWVCLLLTIPVLVFSPMIQGWFGFRTPEFPGSPFIAPLFATMIFLYGGVPFIQMAIPELQRRNPGMMTLISLAILTAFIYSSFTLIAGEGSDFYWEMATLIDVMLLGHWMEMRSVRQASGALNELAALLPDTAERIREDGTTEEVPTHALQPGELVLIRPGSSVPVDGEIIEGQSSVNEAMITGESKPVTKAAGDPVIGGTINGDGSLRVQVTATGDETALAGIMKLVEEAQQSKTDTQILADRAAGWLTYLAVAAAIITGILWSVAIGFQIDVIERVVTVLVIACPHALGLAIPLVVAISTSLGAKNGILIRNRSAMETAREINTVVFDKTGTLTMGQFGVTDWIVTPDKDAKEVLALAAAVEGDSEHPIAQGIRQKAAEEGVQPLEVKDFEAIQGKGIQASYQGQKVYVGGPRLLETLEVDLPEHFKSFTDTADHKGQSVVYLVDDQGVVAAFALADLIREASREAVQELHALDVTVVMMTGDSQAVATAVAAELGIDRVFAQVLPQDKERHIADLQKQGKRVAMVGDGVNDAPALTRADIGIAIGGGTDVAIESADIILVQSNPLDVVKIFALSRATYRKMIQNLIWATGYNILAIPLAAGILAPISILLSPAVGAALMSLSTVIVAINAQFLRRLDLAGAR